MYEVEITQRSVRNAVFCTPDKVTFKGPITFDERVWEWLMRDVHLFDVREVSWEHQ